MVDTVHRRNARRLAREALRRKVEQGYVGGGLVYGYTNRDVGSGKKRDHVEREVEPNQASIVRRIFTLSADGWGLLRIAKALNAEGIPSPTGRGWASTGTRETFPGRRDNGQLQGRREPGLVSQYLLSGFLRCGTCGGNLIVTARSGRGGVKRYFICTVAHHRGQDICTNVHGIPYEPFTEAVVETFKASILNPVVFDQMLRDRLDELAASPDAAKEEAEALRRDVAKIDRETARLVLAVAEGTGDVAPLTEGIRSRERQKADLQARLEHLDGLRRAAESFDPAAWLQEMSDLLADLRDGFRVSPGAGRRIIRVCLPRPLKVTPAGEGGWDYDGEGRFTVSALRAEIRAIRGHFTPANPDPLEVVPPG
jgi:hypothetical protein